MAKGFKPDRTPAEDYLAHLEWHSVHGYRHRPWWTSPEPKWIYKIIYSRHKPSEFIFARIIAGVLCLAVLSALLYGIFILHSGLAIYMGIVFLIILVILFFAIRDARQSSDTDSHSADEDET